ncbi:flagellar hook length control protein FliK [Enterobacter bugandensis]
MITLQQLLTTESDLPGSTLTGKGAEEGAQDFLSLLAGALTDTAAQGKDTPLTLADLKAAGSRLAKVAQQDGSTSPLQAKIADLLTQQDAATDGDAAQTSALQTLVSGLMPATSGDALKTLTPAAAKEDSKTELSEEELAGLSALMAMLPHQQAATPVAPRASGTEGVSARAALASALPATGSSQQALPGQEKAQAQSAYQPVAQPADNALPAGAAIAPAVAPAAEKQEIASSASSPSPTATIAPIAASHVTSQPAATVATAPVLSQPLGTSEWQQTLSQHITLFTRQGQQTAELRLHPEDLGQVQISLKLDDNQAQLQMVSAHSHVRAALEAALPMLRTSLAENGIQLSQSSVSSESFAGQQQQSSSQQQHQASRSGQHGAFNEESDELLPTPAALQSAARGNGAVDIFA